MMSWVKEPLVYGGKVCWEGRSSSLMISSQSVSESVPLGCGLHWCLSGLFFSYPLRLYRTARGDWSWVFLFSQIGWALIKVSLEDRSREG